jgi:hypothetical protein
MRTFISPLPIFVSGILDPPRPDNQDFSERGACEHLQAKSVTSNDLTNDTSGAARLSQRL